jgi:hypothetical protein
MNSHATVRKIIGDLKICGCFLRQANQMAKLAMMPIKIQ